MLSECCLVSLEIPSKADFLLLVFNTCQSPPAETRIGIDISTNTTIPGILFLVFHSSNTNANYNVDLILKYK